MGKDLMGYEQLTQNALRQVVRLALERAAAQGIPGDHHFFITFDTKHPETKIADYLKARYPEEMTIVLQHQFWGLKVEPDRFEVTLSFNKVGEHLIIPYAAIRAFFDPSVQFGLQFKGPGQAGIRRMPGAGAKLPAATNQQSAARAKSEAKKSQAQAAEAEKPKAPATGEVVNLDAFRKK